VTPARCAQSKVLELERLAPHHRPLGDPDPALAHRTPLTNAATEGTPDQREH